MRVLHAHRAAQNADRLRLGQDFGVGNRGIANNHQRLLGLRDGEKLDDLVFAREDGTLWHPDAFGWAFGAIVKRADIGHVRLHDLRHSSASLLIQKGMPMKVVSERLGHSTMAITADLYTHVFDAQQDAAAEAIDDVLAPALLNDSP